MTKIKNKNTENSCPTCGGDEYEHIDLFGIGETLDHHMAVDITEEELKQRLSDAVETTGRFGGTSSLGLEEELGILTEPKLTWEDFTRALIVKRKDDCGRNDWSRPKVRQLFAGLYVPKKRDYIVNILVAYDCSASMNVQTDISYGISQIQCLDDRCEGWLVPWDIKPYYESTVKITSAQIDQLKQAKVVGRGGTAIMDLFKTYEDHIGQVDIIIIITDGEISDLDKLKKLSVNKDTSVVWLITGHNSDFDPNIGKVFHLYNE